MTEEQFKRLKADVETARADSERAQGALDQLMGRLKQEYDCSTLKEAKVLLATLEAKRDKAQQEFETALAVYERKWKRP